MCTVLTLFDVSKAQRVFLRRRLWKGKTDVKGFPRWISFPICTTTHGDTVGPRVHSRTPSGRLSATLTPPSQ